MGSDAANPSPLAEALKTSTAYAMPKNLDTPRTFPKLTSKAEWEALASMYRAKGVADAHGTAVYVYIFRLEVHLLGIDDAYYAECFV